MNSPPSLDFLLRDLAQAVDLSGLALYRTLRDLNSLSNQTLGSQRIGDSVCTNSDDANTGIVRGSIVYAISQVAQPGLEHRAVMLLDESSVRHDRGATGDGCPFTRGILERDVDFGVAGNVICLSGFCVCVEEQVDAFVFLWRGC